MTEPSKTKVLRLLSADGSVTVFVHPSVKPGYKDWQVTYFSGDEVLGDASFDSLDEAVGPLTAKGFIIDKAT